jgi:hypothetical protein
MDKFLKLPWKNIVLVSSIIIFFVVLTIVIILFAQGKEVTPEGVKSTGIVRLFTVPDDVNAYVDGEKVRLIENRIESVNPGEIRLRLEKDGFEAWEKTLFIEEGKVKNVYAQLFPQEINAEKISSTNIDQVTFPLNKETILFSVINSEIKDDNGIWRYELSKSLLDFGDNVPERLKSFDEELLKKLRSNDYDFDASNDSRYILINIPNLKERYILSVDNSSENIFLNEELGFYPSTATWYKNSESILIENNNIVFEYKINSDEKILVNYDPTSAPRYSIASDKIYYFQNNIEEIMSYSNNNSITLEEEIITKRERTPISIHTSESLSNIIVIKDQSGLYFYDIENEYQNKFSNKGEIIEVANNGKSVLFRRNQKIFSHTLEETFDDRIYRTKTNEIKTESEPTNIYYSTNNTNIIIFTENKNDKFYTLQITDVDGQNTQTIAKDLKIAEPIAQITNNGNALYLLIEESDKAEISEVNEEETNNLEDEEIEVIQNTVNLFKIDLVEN